MTIKLHICFQFMHEGMLRCFSFS